MNAGRMTGQRPVPTVALPNPALNPTGLRLAG
jgi:hypothetical protein